jgi:hypothetical protein
MEGQTVRGVERILEAGISGMSDRLGKGDE